MGVDIFKWIFIGVGALIAVELVVFIVYAICKSKKKKKENAAMAADKNNAEQALEKERQADAQRRQAAQDAENARQAAIRAEVFAKLEKQSEEPVKAEKAKEEPKAVAKEEPVKKEAKAEVAVAAEKPVEKKPVAKKATPKQETKKETVAPAPVPAPAPKKAPAKKAKKEETPVAATASGEVSARYAGKWEIYHIVTDDNSVEDMYFFELRASNGEKLLSSEEYTSYQGAVRGIETHKQNIAKDNFRITPSKKGDYIVKLLSGSGQLLCTGENYATTVRCESAIKSIKRFAQTAILDENAHEFLIKVPKEEDGAIETPTVAEGVSGKWVISSRGEEAENKMFFFELFANNGEKLLTSEEYTTYTGAVNGLQTHKQNIAKGNFRITLTKKGDYIYKILNGNGQLLCLGEHYKSKVRCQNAVESVKRFAENSPVLTDTEQE